MWRLAQYVNEHVAGNATASRWGVGSSLLAISLALFALAIAFAHGFPLWTFILVLVVAAVSLLFTGYMGLWFKLNPTTSPNLNDLSAQITTVNRSVERLRRSIEKHTRNKTRRGFRL